MSKRTTTPRGPAASPVTEDRPEAHGLRLRESVSNYPPVDTWDDVVVYDAKAHPRKVERHYMLVPTEAYPFIIESVLAGANAGMSATFCGVARAAAPLDQHQHHLAATVLSRGGPDAPTSGAARPTG